MTRSGRSFRSIWVLAGVAAGVAAFWLDHPWTTRPIGASTGSSSTSSDPAARIDALWSSRLLPAMTAAAVDARTLLDALAASRAEAHKRYGRFDGSGSWYVVVRGTARILSVDRQHAAGLASLDLTPFDGRPDLSLQIGPVVRGTSLRDATGLINFTDFANQLQFADAAIALNNRAMSTVVLPIAAELTAGRVVVFVGAAGGDPDSEPALSDVVPVQLEITRGNDG